jgi:carnitine monooxygenase subunit
MTDLPYDALTIPNDWDRRGLPAWTYHSPALFALERERLFLTHWQLVGHVCDIPAPVTGWPMTCWANARW